MTELHFSANGLGVVLNTTHGGLRFNAEEFAYYQNLFKIADSHSQGKLALKSIQLNSLLIRTDLAWEVSDKILSVVSKYKTDGEDKTIDFYQWLMICKLIAFFQETKRAISDKVFQKLHTSKIKIPPANFALGQARQTFAVGTYYEELKVTLAEWIFSGEDYQNHHVKFRIETTSTPVKGAHESTELGPEYPTQVAKYSVERRYSEFEAFALILQKNYKSIVVPPLPLKTWSFLSQSEATAHQRAIEFQMFLNDLTSHPVLRYSYELKAFLQTSSQGYKCLVDLYGHINEGKFVSVGSPSSQQINEVVTKLFTDGAAAVTTTATSFFSSMWDSVKKNVPLLATPPPTRPPSSEADQKFHRTALFLEGVANAGKKLENLVTHEREYYNELAKIALCCKYMAEFETIPELTRVLSVSHSGMSGGSKALLLITDKAYFEAQIPLVYMGRYKDSFQLVQTQRAKVEEEQRAARREEQFAQQRVELAHSALIGAGGSVNHASNGHVNGNGHSHGTNGANGANGVKVDTTSAKGAASPNTTSAPASAASPTSTSASNTSSGAASNTTSITSPQTASQAEQRAAATEAAFNQAKLDLAAAEDNFESRRAAAEEMTNTMRAESARLEGLQKAQLVKVAKAFVHSRIEAARSSAKYWEDLRAELEAGGSFGGLGSGAMGGGVSSAAGSTGEKGGRSADGIIESAATDGAMGKNGNGSGVAETSADDKSETKTEVVKEKKKKAKK